MNSLFEGFSSFTVVAAVVLVARDAVESLVGARRRAAAFRASEENRRREALDSADILVLGRYLTEEIGSISISEYARNPTLQAQADAALARVSSFLGSSTDGKVSAGEPFLRANESMVDALLPAWRGVEADGELREAVAEIREGRVWNGLARMRRHLEVELNRLAEVRNVSTRRKGVGMVVNDLRRTGAISADAAGLLQSAIRVANAGIHGEEVDPLTAEEAIMNAVVGWQIVKEESDTELDGSI